MAKVLFFGLYFILSGSGKVINIQRFMQGVKNYEIITGKWIFVAACGIPLLELIVGFSLLFSQYISLLYVIALLMLTFFTIIAFIIIKQNRKVQCYCHGVIDKSIITKGTLARNAFLIIVVIIGLIFSLVQDSHFTSSFHFLLYQNTNLLNIICGGLITITLFIFVESVELMVALLETRQKFVRVL